METSGKKGNFEGYSETSKAFKIYVLGERSIEVSRDVTFHEEVVFKRSKEIAYDTNTEQHETPISEGFDHDYSPSDVQRENLAKHVEIPAIDEPPTNRSSTWC